MYEVIQNKEKVSRRIDDSERVMRKRINNLEKGGNYTNRVYQKFEIPANYEEHVKGECKKNKLTGGHSQQLMASKWNSFEGENLTIKGTQKNDEVYTANWFIKKYKNGQELKKYIGPPKESTFFPDSWNYARIQNEIKSVSLTKGKNYGESISGIKIAKSGDTAYPVILENQEAPRRKKGIGRRG